MKPHPRVRELWSNVSLIEPGSAGRAAFADGGTVYTGSLQGFLTRRTWKSGGFQLDWSVPLGRAIEAIECTGQTLVVGSKRGLALVDAQRGTLIRETVGIGSVSDVEVGDLIPEVPGLEIAAVPTRMYSTSNRSTAVCGCPRRWLVPVARCVFQLDEQPRLFIPLSLGHVAGFHFVKVADQDWIPEATWLSEYLAKELTAIIHLEIDGEPHVVAGGEGGATLAVIDPRGKVVDRIALNTWVETLAPWDGHQLLVAGSGGIYRVDLTTPTSESTDGTTRVHPISSDGSHVVTTDLDGDGVRELIAFQHASTAAPSIVVRNAACEQLWRRDGRWTSSALDVSYVAAERRWELSVLDRNWQVDRFDFETGAVLGSLPVRRPTFTQSPARRLVRLSSARSLV